MAHDVNFPDYLLGGVGARHHVLNMLDSMYFTCCPVRRLNDLAIASVANNFLNLIVAVDILPRISFQFLEHSELLVPFGNISAFMFVFLHIFVKF